ncbi:MAG: methyltransferase domain-containing protein [Gemmatimonadetes bacterium]|nr:methyltransferase domain-containing protein [Gemmatimonadota bacterium]
MDAKLLDLLVCPGCRAELACDAAVTDVDGGIVTGALKCTGCGASYPIERGIPRFVPSENYASSFGYQWNRFKQEQIDSTNGTRQSENRVFSETGWTREWLRGKWVLDAGCGAGRFLDALTDTEAQVVGVDITNAVDAAQSNLGGKRNVHLVQASIYELPFRDGAFDGCYCIGVIQHTPDPDRTVRSLPRVVKEGGRLAVTIYERRRFTPLNMKYLVRPLTRRMSRTALLSTIRATMPVFFPLTELLFRIPVLGRAARFVIPVANYVEKPDLNVRQRYQWAVLDTFDMLAPAYDQPQREDDVRRALESSGVRQVTRLPNPGLNLVGVK